MSRADREKALYVYKLTVIKENLAKSYPELAFSGRDIANHIDQKIKDELEDVNEDSSEDDESFDEEAKEVKSHNDKRLRKVMALSP